MPVRAVAVPEKYKTHTHMIRKTGTADSSSSRRRRRTAARSERAGVEKTIPPREARQVACVIHDT